jgi:hypothetical protein
LIYPEEELFPYSPIDGSTNPRNMLLHLLTFIVVFAKKRGYKHFPGIGAAREDSFPFSSFYQIRSSHDLIKEQERARVVIKSFFWKKDLFF